MANVGIKNSWNFVSFVSGKRLRIGDFISKESGQTYKSLILGEGELIFIHFAEKLGELTPAELKAQKTELQVVELETGSYVLCKQGQSSWIDVEL